MDKKELIYAKLKQLREDRALNRVARTKFNTAPYEKSFEAVQLADLKNYIDEPPLPRPTYSLTIIPTHYENPPPPPKIEKGKSYISSLATLFPIGTLQTGMWFIVSPYLYCNRIFDYDKEWLKHTTRYTSIIMYSARLTSLIAKERHKKLQYPIKIEKNKISIIHQGEEYLLTSFEPLRRFKIALQGLNDDAFSIGHVEKQALLPNLYAALSAIQTNDIGSVYESPLATSIEVTSTSSSSSK